MLHKIMNHAWESKNFHVEGVTPEEAHLFVDTLNKLHVNTAGELETQDDLTLTSNNRKK